MCSPNCVAITTKASSSNKIILTDDPVVVESVANADSLGLEAPAPVDDDDDALVDAEDEGPDDDDDDPEVPAVNDVPLAAGFEPDAVEAPAEVGVANKSPK